MDQVRTAAVVALLGALSSGAFALAGHASVREPSPDPADPRAQVPPVRYESPMAGYRSAADGADLSWTGANELARKLGGWAAYARDKVPDGPTAPRREAPSHRPASGASQGAHEGHGKR